MVVIEDKNTRSATTPDSSEETESAPREKPLDWLSVGVGFVVILGLAVLMFVFLTHPSRRKRHDPRVRVQLRQQSVQLTPGQSYTVRPRLFRKNLFGKSWRERPFSARRYEVTLSSLRKPENPGLTIQKQTITARRPGDYHIWVQIKSIPGVSRYRVHRSIPLRVRVVGSR